MIMDIVPPAEDINARSESIRSGKVLILAMRRTRSLRKSASKGGVSSGEDVSPGRTRRRISRGSSGPGPRAQQSARPRAADGPQGGGVRCHNCEGSIPYGADLVTIQPCRHQICTYCCIVSHVERGCVPHTCPVDGCNCYSRKLEYVRAGARMPIAIINRVIGDDQYVKRHLPTVWLKQQHQAEIKETPENEGVVISCSKIRQ